MKLIGLDFEASGSNPWQEHVPIQIGVTDGEWEATYFIGQWDWDEYEWDEEAFEVHGITQERLAEAEPVWKVDIRLAAQMLDVVKSRMWTIPVGWNVAGYDRQFITRWFPNVNRLLSYRSIDLGAICFAIGGSEGGYKQIKSQAKEYAAERIGGETAWHDALYDAKAALYSYEYLRTLIQ